MHDGRHASAPGILLELHVLPVGLLLQRGHLRLSLGAKQRLERLGRMKRVQLAKGYLRILNVLALFSSMNHLNVLGAPLQNTPCGRGGWRGRGSEASGSFAKAATILVCMPPVSTTVSQRIESGCKLRGSLTLVLST